MDDPTSFEESKLLKIGDVAKKTGITLRTLRYYEELKLIEPDNRTPGNFRLYHSNVIQRVQFINSLKKLDFTLEQIREILGGTNAPRSGDRDVIEITYQALQVKREKLEAKLLEMEDMKREVDISLQVLEECLSCCKHNSDDPCSSGCGNKQIHI